MTSIGGRGFTLARRHGTRIDSRESALSGSDTDLRGEGRCRCLWSGEVHGHPEVVGDSAGRRPAR